MPLPGSLGPHVEAVFSRSPQFRRQQALLRAFFRDNPSVTSDPCSSSSLSLPSSPSLDLCSAFSPGQFSGAPSPSSAPVLSYPSSPILMTLDSAPPSTPSSTISDPFFTQPTSASPSPAWNRSSSPSPSPGPANPPHRASPSAKGVKRKSYTCVQKLAAVDYLHTGVVCTGELDAMGQAVTIPIWNYRAAADLKITTKMLREWAAEEDRIRRAVPGARKVKKVRGPVTQQQRGGKAWEGKQGVCDELAEACEDGKDREDGEDETGQKSGLEAPIDHLARLSLYDVLEVPH